MTPLRGCIAWMSEQRPSALGRKRCLPRHGRLRPAIHDFVARTKKSHGWPTEVLPRATVPTILVVVCALIPSLLLQAESQAAEVVMDAIAVAFVLDDKGDVWAFEQPNVATGAEKLPALHDVVQIAPFAALTRDGQVYVWYMGQHTVWGVSEGVKQAEYTTPQLVRGLTNVTYLSSAMGRPYWHFAAVEQGERVYEWDAHTNWNTDTGAIGQPNFSDPVLVFSHPDIIGVATNGMTTVVLIKNGPVIGWGQDQGLGPQTDVMSDISPYRPRRISLKWPAASVHLSSNHLIILTNDGTARFWGGCEPREPPLAVIDGLDGEAISISDIVAVSASFDDDNLFSDAFLRRDGSVWLGHAPAPAGDKASDCRNHSGRDPPGDMVRLGGMTVPAVSVAIGGYLGMFPIMAIGADHTLWGTSYSKQDFTRLPMNIPH
jgi:hypothetical protein